MRVIVLFARVCVSWALSAQQPGTLDSIFGQNGIFSLKSGNGSFKNRLVPLGGSAQRFVKH